MTNKPTAAPLSRSTRLALRLAPLFLKPADPDRPLPARPGLSPVSAFLAVSGAVMMVGLMSTLLLIQQGLLVSEAGVFLGFYGGFMTAAVPAIAMDLITDPCIPHQNPTPGKGEDR